MPMQWLKSLKSKHQPQLETNTEKNEPTPNVKDYSLHSGERQTAESLINIRQDHTARYLLAIEHIKSFIQPQKDYLTLDLFCGNGYGSFMLSEAFNNIYTIGIDGSTEAIALANDHYSRPNNLFAWKLFPFELPAAHFDYITCFESLEHVKNDIDLIENIIKSTKENGYIFISVPNQEIHDLKKNPHKFHYRHYQHEEFINKVKNKLELIDWYGQNIYQFDDNGINTFQLLPTNEMQPTPKEHGQVNIYVFQKI